MADDKDRDDYGGAGYRYGGSSSGGYGTGGAAADFEDVVGHGPLSAREAFPQDFRGRGPKGYVRPDARILDDLSDRLAEAPDLDASDIEPGIEAGEVTLRGAVETRTERHRAEDIAEAVSGVRHVCNDLRVRYR
jgi:osmotically-inducible protein OsmY